jgi:MFS family permease
MTAATGSADARRLFIGACFALIATSVAFATVGAVMLALKRDFVLTNQQVGWIGGAALWGFAVSQLIFAPLCDTLGMRFLVRLAWLSHLVGTLVMIFATGFWLLFAGALVIAMANGLVEAACNPLVATLYPDDKTVKLNQFHVWFPGGIVVGGLAAYGLDAAGIGAWQIKLVLILIPTLIYGVLLLRQPFPATEGVAAGVGVGETFKAAFTTPFMWVMLVAMAMTASVELGPNRWVPAVLEAGGMPGILVLVWISGLMAVLRFKAGAVVHRLSPTGVLLASAVLSGLGLIGLYQWGAGAMAFVAATVFAVGVCYFWPTMLGVVSERVPRSGALGLGLMGAVGMATVGLVTAPQMGRIADTYAHDRIPAAEARSVIGDGARMFEAMQGEDARAAAQVTAAVQREFDATGLLPSPGTANALRAIIGADPGEGLAERAASILGPADNYGGRVSFLYLVPVCGILILVFGAMYVRDRRVGGYTVRDIGASD